MLAANAWFEAAAGAFEQAASRFRFGNVFLKGSAEPALRWLGAGHSFPIHKEGKFAFRHAGK
jgi:hypothetical protein